MLGGLPPGPYDLAALAAALPGFAAVPGQPLQGLPQGPAVPGQALPDPAAAAV